jgi:hypothetical protein
MLKDYKWFSKAKTVMKPFINIFWGISIENYVVCFLLCLLYILSYDRAK